MEHTTAAAPPRAHEDERLRRMDALARDVLRLARNTLLVHLRFLDAALSRFTPERADGGRIATDGQVLRYDPQYVLLSYRDERERPTRDFLHLVLHCAFRHAFVDPRLDRVCWDLACDIAAECAIDSLGLPCVAAQRQAQQQPIVQRLLREGVPLTAEKIYRYFKNERCLEADMLRALREPFLADEHDLWYLDLPAQQRDGERAEEPARPARRTMRTSPAARTRRSRTAARRARARTAISPAAGRRRSWTSRRARGTPRSRTAARRTRTGTPRMRTKAHRMRAKARRTGTAISPAARRTRA